VSSTQTTPSFRHEFQVFTWLSDTWDIAKLIAAIDSGALRPKKEKLDREFIEAYSLGVLCLDRIRDVDAQRHSVLMHVDVKAALALPTEALSEPVILLETRKNKGILRLGEDGTNHVLADGNHRIAKAFFEDVPSVDAYVLSAAQSRKYRLN
jgi:hypothetical protein